MLPELPEEVPARERLPEYPAGWYTNPEGTQQRYWDGARWTDQYSQPAEGARRKRWYRRPWGIVGLVVGVLSLLIVVGSLVFFLLTAEEAPSVVGLDLTRAERKIEAAGLDMRVEGYVGGNREHVCEQNPAAGELALEVTLRFGLACKSVREAAERRTARLEAKRQQIREKRQAEKEAAARKAGQRQEAIEERRKAADRHKAAERRRAAWRREQARRREDARRRAAQESAPSPSAPTSLEQQLCSELDQGYNTLPREEVEATAGVDCP